MLPLPRLAAAVAAHLVVLAGCAKKDASTPDGDPKNPFAGLGQTPTDEDPDVLKQFRAKGWQLFTDQRLADGKRLVYLTVEDKAKPFEDVTLAPDDYRLIARSRTAQAVNLLKAKCTDDGLRAVAAGNMPRLEAVMVAGEEVTDAGVKALAGCQGLDSVTLHGTKKVTDAGVRELAALPNLRTLYLAFLTLDGSALEAFAGHKTLTSLTLEYVDGFTDAGAGHVAKLPALDELKIGSGFGEKKLTAAGIKAIVDARLPAKFEFDRKLIDDGLLAALVAKGWLYGPTPAGARDKKPATAAEVRFLNLGGSSITDQGFGAVADCTNATSVHLDNTRVGDGALRALAGFPKLDYLALEKTKVTAAGLEAVSGRPLKHVALQGCELTEDAFRALGKMKGLEELWLSDAKLKGEWLKHLAGLPKLKDLNLMRADVDDAAVKHLLALPAIESLTLNDTKLTDAGFGQLFALPKLKSLYVDGTKVTKDVYKKAKADHPKVSLYFYRHDN